MYDIDYQIPISDHLQDAGSYHDVPVDFDDPRHAEPLVTIGSVGIAGESYYARNDGNNWPYCQRISGALKRVWLRQSVAQKLTEINLLLAPFEVELYLWDGYRPVNCQRGLWRFFHERAETRMRNATAAERMAYVLRYVSDPTEFKRDDSRTWPVHTSGGAVDLTLRCIKTGKLLAMGSRFDNMKPVSHSDFFERQVAQGKIDVSDPKVQNRRLLHWAMSKEGFVNYPFEYWHFDWGDQMYIENRRAQSGTGSSMAWYGYAELPENAEIVT